MRENIQILKTLRNNFSNIVQKLDKMIMNEYSKNYPELDFVKNDSNLINEIAVISSQNSRIIAKLLKEKTGRD